MWQRLAIILSLSGLLIAGGLQLAVHADEEEVVGRGDPTGLVFRLAEASPEVEAVERPPVAEAQPLSAEETDALLARLDPLVEDPSASRDFAVRESTLPPPIAGDTIERAFPPESADDAPDGISDAPLSVARHAPEGEVPLAPHLSITFSEAMAPVTSIAELAATDVPVTIEPGIPGDWRWVGTRTLFFEAEGERMPMATEFRASVKPGVRSAAGKPLGEPHEWSFATPAPRITSFYPSDSSPQSLSPVVFLGFDQRIDPAAILEHVVVTARRTRHALGALTAEEVAASERLTAMARSAGDSRWVAFRVLEKLPSATTVQVELIEGAPSAEGPRTTPAPQIHTLKTRGPLKIEEYRCGWGDRCAPGAPWMVRFSNPLDEKAFDAEWVSVTPELPRMNVQTSGNWLTISGIGTPETRYDVTISRQIRDAFDQELGQDQELVFRVGAADPTFRTDAGMVTVLDPGGKPSFPVYTINHEALRVKAWRVTTADFPAYVAALRAMSRDRDNRFSPPGEVAIDEKVTTPDARHELVETSIDLSAGLEGGRGHLILRVEPARRPAGQNRNPFMITWVQSTGIGLDAFVDGAQMLAWATSLSNGEPLEGVSLRLEPAGVTGASAATGLATIPLPADVPRDQFAYLVAESDGDAALLPSNNYPWGRGGWRARQSGKRLLFHVVDDRRLYRPGETVSVAGWMRQLPTGPRGDLELPDRSIEVLAYEVTDARRNPITSGEVTLSAHGSFGLQFEIPDTSSLGGAQLRLSMARGDRTVVVHRHGFNVQEFRRPEFEVKAVASPGPHTIGGKITVDATASYFSGGALPGAPATWSVTATPASYAPPGHDGFNFGTWTPWWRSRHTVGGGVTKQLTSRTDASGEHHLEIELVSVEPPRASSIEATVAITDVNRQTWTARAAALVHPAELYVGLRAGRAFVEIDRPIEIDCLVCDIDGKIVSGVEVQARMVRLDWVKRGGNWVEEESDPVERTVSSADAPVPVSLPTAGGGSYRLTLSLRDSDGRANRTVRTFWVAGGKQPPSRRVEVESVELVPSKESYQPGETAELLVVAPFADAEALLLIEREGILRRERFRLAGTTHTIEIPIESGHTPNLHVAVELVGASARLNSDGDVDATLPKRPALARGTIDLSVPPLERTLVVSTLPSVEVAEPGAGLEVSVAVKDSTGAAVADAEVLVIVVDEAILALAGGSYADPLSTFYPHRGDGVGEKHLRTLLRLSDPEQLISLVEESEDLAFGSGDPSAPSEGAAPPAADGGLAAPGGLAELKGKSAAPRRRGRRGAIESTMESDFDGENGGGGGEETPIRMRSDLNPLAAFVSGLVTDGDGRVSTAVKLPDNLTRYRVQAIAVHEASRFGMGDAAITARLPLQVRPSPPRFLSYGDEMELPIVVANQTDAPLSIDVAVRATGVELTGTPGQRVQVPAGDRVEVRFSARAASAGKARFQAVAAAVGAGSDAASFEFPVWTPATTEAFATYGELDGDSVVRQPVKLPDDIVLEFGGLELSTSSTELAALTDAVLYLHSYPFECAEQLSSRVIGVTAMADVLPALSAAEMPSPAELAVAVDRDLLRLAGMQNDDGSFGFWRRYDRPYPFLGIHAAHAFARARAAGHEVPGEAIDRSRAYLANIENVIEKRYGKDARLSLIAYALSVRKLMGDDVAETARRVTRAGGGDLTVESAGWLLDSLAGAPAAEGERDVLLRFLNNRAEETAATASFTTSYGDGDTLLLHSNRRSDAVATSALVAAMPASDLLPKLVRGLLGARSRGRWGNTQENVFVLVALGDYFRAFESVEPRYTARAWLGQSLVAEEEFAGRDADRRHLMVPFDFLARGGEDEALVLAKEGPGRLYWRLGMRYAPRSLELEPYEAGFAVSRTYRSLGDADDVRRDSDGVWRVKAGANVVVELTMAASSRRHHVALVDWLPAGLEPTNPALAMSQLPRNVEAEIASSGRRPWWWGQWWEHQNLRDERVEAFTSQLWAGVYTYRYHARATTPGRFIAPPAKAEEMYHPETFGRSATERFVVE